MAPGQVSDQCQIVLGANLANLGPYPFGRTLWKRGVQYATKHQANIMLGTRLGSFQINLQFCWPSPKDVLSTWYSLATMCCQGVVPTIHI